MTLTINSDASYHPVFKVGAFAFWIVWSGGRLIQSGALKSVLSAQDAELQSIGNALHAVLKTSIDGLQHVYINTDCKYGIDAVNKGKHMGGCQQTVRKIHTLIQKLRVQHRFKIGGRFKDFVSWRYVPAHTEGGTPREWVNNRMDQMAKQALWDQINKSKK